MLGDTHLAKRESLVGARFVTAGVMLAATMIVAIPACNGAPQKAPQKATQKAARCDCAKPQAKTGPATKAKAMPRAKAGAHSVAARHHAYRRPHRLAGEGFNAYPYDYQSAAPVRPAGWHDEWHGVWQGEWHGDWDGQWHGAWRGQWQGAWQPVPDEGYPPPRAYDHVPDGYAPNGYAPGPSAYGPPQGEYGEGRGYGDGPGLTIDRGGWSGGVGYGAADYGSAYGYGYGDGPGNMNGPTYNSYGQSFQYNPSRARPFRPRRMGGMAPPPHFNPGFGHR